MMITGELKTTIKYMIQQIIIKFNPSTTYFNKLVPSFPPNIEEPPIFGPQLP